MDFIFRSIWLILNILKKNYLRKENFKKFYSSLTNKKNNDKKYKDVLNDWKNIEMKTMKDYHDLYLKCDVLLLADVCEKFRNNSLKNYGLCWSHYLSAPSLGWDATLKMTKIELELITYPHMYILFENFIYLFIYL